MNSVKEDKKSPLKITRYHLTMAFLALVIVAVGLTTIFSTSSSAAEKKTVKPKASFQLATNNQSTNPNITLDCEKPRLTVAVMIDRSGSVSANQANPGKYKESVKKFVEDLSSILISRDGDLDVLLWAYGSRSIQQNDKTSSNQLITKVDSTTSLEAMKETVDKIFFSQQANGENDLSMNGNTTDYAKARGYNAGYPTTGNYSFTNWDDALLQVKNIGQSPAYNDPTPGKHINLALMLTDGAPNVNNGSNRVFGVDDLSNVNSAAGRVYSSNTVTQLRQGSGLPKMAVRGVLINSNSTAAMDEVFGPSNWSLADDFDKDLQRVLDEIIQSIDSNVECQYVYLTPRIDVAVSSSNINIIEGPAGSRTVQVTIKNTSTVTDRKGNPIPCDDQKCSLKNASFTYNGATINLGTLAYTTPEQGPITISVELGETIPNNQIVINGRAEFEPSKPIRLAPNLDTNEGDIYVATDSSIINVSIKRVPLPA